MGTAIAAHQNGAAGDTAPQHQLAAAPAAAAEPPPASAKAKNREGK